jgi:hypothetical protein
MTNTSDPIRDLFEIKKSVLQKKLRRRCGAWLSTPRHGAKFQTSPNRYITKGGNSKAPGGTAHMAHTFFYCLWFLCWIITSINHCTEWKPAFYKGTHASQFSAIFFQSFLDMSSALTIFTLGRLSAVLAACLSEFRNRPRQPISWVEIVILSTSRPHLLGKRGFLRRDLSYSLGDISKFWINK